MEYLGIIPDVSHLSDAGFYDVLKHSKKPFVASHSNARSICNHVRNMDDEMIKLLANKGGVMGINFCAAFISPATNGHVFGTISDTIEHIKYMVDHDYYYCHPSDVVNVSFSHTCTTFAIIFNIIVA